MPSLRRGLHLRHSLRIGAFLAVCALLTAGPGGRGADAVIMSDGFVLQGHWFKETEIVSDPAVGSIRIEKAGGFDVIEDGPKFIIFSRHAQRGGKLEKDIARPDYQVYKTKAIRPRDRLPHFQVIDIGKFDAKWHRLLSVKIPPNPSIPGGAKVNIGQQVVSLDPNCITLDSTNYIWRAAYHTAEENPETVRQLLATHPELKDPPGKVDPHRRLSIANFLKDVGWLRVARDELARLKKDAPPPWDKEVTERYDRLVEDIDRAEAKQSIDELEMAVQSGRYGFAQRFAEGFHPRTVEPREGVRLAGLKAQIETLQPTYELTVRLLRKVIEQEGGLHDAQVYAAVAGSPGLLYGPRPKLTPERTALLTAAGAVLNELHPDTASRLELFRMVAEQVEQRRKGGKDPGEKPADLLALAVTGWLKGKNGAEKNVAAAVQCWKTREMALAYLREEIGNNRKALLDAHLATGKPLGPDELSQLVTLLPPPLPENLQNIGGVRVPVKEAGAENVYRRNSGGVPGLPNGADYFLHLPPEYHHGRAYPLIILLSSQHLAPEKLVGFLAGHADRHGYILAAPVWANQFGPQSYDYSGKDHVLVTATLRDLSRRFQVDPDRVFLYGLVDGANFALDVGLAKPDLFAGVVPICPDAPPQIYQQYWHNAQKLPIYAVTGELTGAFPNLRKVYEKWTASGFPTLLTVYKGRGLELYPMERPRIFDWMGRKKRVRGAASLRLNQTGFEPWQVLRESDDRFYWMGVGPGGLRQGNLVADWRTRQWVIPAQFRADIGRNGTVAITEARGIRKFVIWLERDLIDWTKPIQVSINGDPPIGYRPRVLEPDLHLMFEELYRTGDKKMLYLGKLEIDGPG